MIFIEWPWMNETFNRQARKVESWMSEKNPSQKQRLADAQQNSCS